MGIDLILFASFIHSSTVHCNILDQDVRTIHVGCGHTRTELCQGVLAGKCVPVPPEPLSRPRDRRPSRQQTDQIKDQSQGYLPSTLLGRRLL